jgi:hypothetical protein
MSIYSDYKVGAISREEFDNYGEIENRRDRWERAHEYDYIDDFERLEEEEPGEGYEDYEDDRYD